MGLLLYDLIKKNRKNEAQSSLLLSKVPKVPRAKNGSIIVRLVKKNRKNKVELERDSNSISEDCTFLA